MESATLGLTFQKSINDVFRQQHPCPCYPRKAQIFNSDCTRCFALRILLPFCNSPWPTLRSLASAQREILDHHHRHVSTVHVVTFPAWKATHLPPDVVFVRSVGATSLLILLVRRQIPAPGELPSLLFGLQRFIPPNILGHACREPLGVSLIRSTYDLLS